MLTGSALGLSYFLLHDVLSHYFIKDNELNRYRVSHALLGAFTSALVFSPTYVLRGLLLGTIFGELMYMFEAQPKTTQNGFTIYDKNATDADRINSKNQDLIIGHGKEAHQAYLSSPNWKSV